MIRFSAIILVKKDGSVLAQHRDNIQGILEPDKWGIIGGGFEKGVDKDIMSAAVRELHEETGYQINSADLQFLSRDNYFISENLEVERTVYWAWYDNNQEIKCYEGQEIRFIKPEEFEKLEFARDNQAFLAKASKNALSK